MIGEDRELLAELARLNRSMASLCMRMMDGTASAAEQVDYARRLIAAGQRLGPVYSPAPLVLAVRSRRGAGVNDRQNDRARRAAPTTPGLCLHCSPVEALAALGRPDSSVDKIRHVQQHGWLLMITSSAEVDAGSGRGARKLGNLKFCSHQSGPL
jgi:hypothetical protein